MRTDHMETRYPGRGSQ